MIQFSDLERALSWHEFDLASFFLFYRQRWRLLISSLTGAVPDFWLSASSRVIHARTISLDLADCVALLAQALFHLFGDNVSIVGAFADLHFMTQTFRVRKF